ncbi:hypothetical protein AAFF_G00231540 [Aldrovandia affinis]|uniref:Uncharacterized protein n=1 Tax=Aldrovandia affinis TaxID=143900 RepID=A0AAD7RF98_9TELE|nr:hypothetical protein AAFF_G00231540 [Aldrovandia affinis]
MRSLWNQHRRKYRAPGLGLRFSYARVTEPHGRFLLVRFSYARVTEPHGRRFLSTGRGSLLRAGGPALPGATSEDRERRPVTMATVPSLDVLCPPRLGRAETNEMASRVSSLSIR